MSDIEDVKHKIIGKQIQLGPALTKLLPMMRGKVADERLFWLVSELQGYQNAIDFYQQSSHSLPTYRIIPGALKVVDKQGNLADLNHPWAKKTQFFLGAPIAWLEDSADVPGLSTMVELPELTNYAGKNLGTIVCECKRADLLACIEAFRRQLISLLTEVGASSPST